HPGKWVPRFPPRRRKFGFQIWLAVLSAIRPCKRTARTKPYNSSKKPKILLAPRRKNHPSVESAAGVRPESKKGQPAFPADLVMNKARTKVRALKTWRPSSGAGRQVRRVRQYRYWAAMPHTLSHTLRSG